MRLLADFKLRIALVGNTGYCNQSKLFFHSHKCGTLQLPYKEWNLNLTKFVMDSSTLNKIELHIPSGDLISTYDQIIEISAVTEKDYYYNQNNPEIKYIFRGQWDGMVAGVEGGMSGYCSFSFNPDTAWVYNSVLAADGSLAYTQYNNRKQRLIDKLGYDGYVETTKQIAIAKKEAEDSEGYYEYPKEWIAELKELDLELV